MMNAYPTKVFTMSLNTADCYHYLECVVDATSGISFHGGNISIGVAKTGVNGGGLGYFVGYNRGGSFSFIGKL